MKLFVAQLETFRMRVWEDLWLFFIIPILPNTLMRRFVWRLGMTRRRREKKKAHKMINAFLQFYNKTLLEWMIRSVKWFSSLKRIGHSSTTNEMDKEDWQSLLHELRMFTRRSVDRGWRSITFIIITIRFHVPVQLEIFYCSFHNFIHRLCVCSLLTVLFSFIPHFTFYFFFFVFTKPYVDLPYESSR